MKLVLCHADDNWANSIKMNIPSDIEVESYNEFYKKERTKAYRVKGSFGARATPFALFYFNGDIKPFYSESGDCTNKEIIRYVNLIYSQNAKSSNSKEDNK